MDRFSYTCSACGQLHFGVPDLSFDSPYHYHAMTPDERATEAQLTADTCVIGDDRFIRGCLQIPVRGQTEPFTYGVWVSLSPEHFTRYLELFESRDRTDEPPYFGWLCNRIPGYPDTLLLKTNVHLRPYPDRPFIELEPTDHPLAVEEREGITFARLQAILEANAHKHDAT